MNVIYYSKFSTPRDSLITFPIGVEPTKEYIRLEIVRHGYPVPDSNVLVFLGEDEIASFVFTDDEKDKMRVC